MNNTLFYITKNATSIKLDCIPIVDYSELGNQVIELLYKKNFHCLNYFGLQKDSLTLQCFILIGNIKTSEILVSSFIYSLELKQELQALSKTNFALHVFERELHENFGIAYKDHPWLKPVRYAHNGIFKDDNMSNYPFYKIESDELHEVGVGPIHAGIIKPGHFRFICNGEQVLHLEIQHGYQHRGIESLMLSKKSILEKTILQENIVGDTTIAYTLSFVQAVEALANINISEKLLIERAIAL